LIIGGSQLDRHALERRNADRAAGALAHLLDAAAQVRIRCAHLLHGRQQCLARRGQVHAAAVAHQQGKAAVALEPRQQLRQRRLGHAQRLRRGRHARSTPPFLKNASYCRSVTRTRSLSELYCLK